MNRHRWMGAVFGIWFAGTTWMFGAEAESGYAYPETRETVALVEAAAGAIAREGEAVFPAFREKGGQWYRGDRYVFVWDLKGDRYVYPPDPEYERQNMMGLKDVGGKPVGRMIVGAAAAGAGKGWVHYQWNRPGDPEPVWKSTYVLRTTAPSGKLYLVGSGIYRAKMERAFLTEEVDAAAALLERNGREAFGVLRDRRRRFFFHDTYVFVTSETGMELVNPAFPGIEGRNLWDVKDIRGHCIVREYIAVALEKGSGWVTYYWPRPGMPQLPVEKLTYVRKVRVGDETLIVGAGMYK